MQIITIDGPAASGKGSVAKIVAKKLGFKYLESGAIYRVVALMAHRYNLDSHDVDEILSLINKIKLEFIDDKVYVNKEDVSELIREENIGMIASKIASVPQIRTKLLDFQRSFVAIPGLVTDGRDMGSVIFPNANLKIFLTASPEVRAKRRFTQLQVLGKSVTITSILHDIQARDNRDSKRNVAPLSFDKSFKMIDNSNMTIDQTVQEIINCLNEVSTGW